MRRIIFLLPAFLLSVGFLTAQNVSNPQQALQFFEKLGLSDQEIEGVSTLMKKSERTRKEASLELNLVKAQLEKLLFPANADLGQVEILLRSSLEWKLKAELADIKLRVELRKLLGEERWERYLWFLRNRRTQAERQNPNSTPKQ